MNSENDSADAEKKKESCGYSAAIKMAVVPDNPIKFSINSEIGKNKEKSNNPTPGSQNGKENDRECVFTASASLKFPRIKGSEILLYPLHVTKIFVGAAAQLRTKLADAIRPPADRGTNTK